MTFQSFNIHIYLNYSHFFSVKTFFDPNYFWPKKNSTKFFVNFGLGIWELGFGIQNLGFRIWGLGSVTWNPVFGIEDLGLRIWDLDSS